ncbi:hypothetical protein [Acinetobacter colistiniresistens]|uniref:Uncharacterized protein n=1 Tax=Acinetobacter colistiniresistens TaxID=280145 RepID=S3TIJ3_9GAMM|nr:hypothetical protein [Acinetobacter colistiniresistens]EPG41446.1 hypothetical protein F907_00314 [Acinetobacter colistiniresistens]TVT81901.1 hypothetical protein FPV60_10055 [Acinetobacter colistiniresistens]
MKMKQWMFGLLASTMILPSISHAAPKVVSREYKLLLDPNNFSYVTEASNVNSYFAQAKTAIENKIARTVTGNMSLDTQREIRFYDTQGSCPLNSMGYSLRERIETGKKEVTLKYRGYDHYITDFEDLSSSVAGAKTKLEDDITRKDNLGFLVVASKSTTVPTTRTINDFEDINTLFSGFKNNYSYSNSQALQVVSGLTIYERKYAGATIDLGEFDADLELSLWYTQMPYNGLKPAVAEVSFKYADGNANYTKKVVSRAALSFSALKALTQFNAPSSTATKTQFVYDYQPGFCQ